MKKVKKKGIGNLLFLFLLMMGAPLAAQNASSRLIVGKVTDQTGETLIGVSVIIKNAGAGVITDLDGNFSITIPDRIKNPVLVFSYLGFQAHEERIGNQKQLRITLQAEDKSLDEVVVIGYGSVKKRDLTGVVDKVDIDAMTKAPVASFDEALAGRIAGVQVSFNEGEPGAEANIVIRGANSVTQGNSPLYVIDGFPIEESMTNAIDPEDIGSIEVLKDASATAIYGARGANGVIIITTKKGKESKPVITYSGSYGIQSVSKTMDVMDGYEFVKLQDEIGRGSIYFRDGKTLEDYRGRGLNFQDYLFREAPMQKHHLSISGGTKVTKYSISASYTNQEGVIINSGYERFQGRATLDQKVYDWLDIGFNTSYTHTRKYGTSPSASGSQGTVNLLQNAWAYRPVTGGDIDDEDMLNDFVDESLDHNNNYQVNPILSAQNEMRERIEGYLVANFYADIKLSKYFKVRSTLGYVGREERQDTYNNSNTREGNPLFSRTGVNGKVGYTEKTGWINENILSYAQTFRKIHSVDALLGYTAQEDASIQNSINMQQLPNENTGMSGLDDGMFNSMSSTLSSQRLMSFLARANYNYDKKYYLTLSFRRDGSSKFAPDNRWSNFPSGALMWRISEEPFMSDLSFISDAKLRASWGVTGNNRVSDYAYMAQVTTVPGDVYYFGDERINSAIVASLGNYALVWENTKQTDLGLDVRFLKNRISFSADIYRKTTEDLLLNADMPGSSGYSNAYKNIGSIRNEGLEFTLNTVNVSNKKFSWTTNFNIGFNRNKVLSLAENQHVILSTISAVNSTYNSLPCYISRLGEPLGLMYGYVYEGTYKNDDFIWNGNTPLLKKGIPYASTVERDKVAPGDMKYKDVNGDGVIDSFDATIIGNGTPVHVGGINNKFTYRNFDLTVFLQWSYGNDVINANKYSFEMYGGFTGNKFASYANRWSPENPTSDIPTYTDHSGTVYSSYAIEDASYIRLKTVSLGYSLPKKLANKVFMNKCRFYASGQNLFTLTNYSGMDPEVSVRNSALTPGFDWSAYPRAMTFTLGVQLSFK